MKTLLMLLGFLILSGIFYRRYEISEKGFSTFSFFGKRKKILHVFHHESPSEVTLQEMIPSPDTVDSRDAIKASTLLKKADAALVKGDCVAAEKFAIQSISLDPSLQEAYKKLGLLYLRQQQFGKAEMIFRRLILGKNPEASYFSNLGLSLYHQNKLAEARTFYEKAIALDAGRAGRFFSLAKILHELNEFELALENFRIAVTMDPTNLDYLLTLAEFYQERGLHDEAQKLIAELCIAFPKEERVLALGQHLQNSKQDFPKES